MIKICNCKKCGWEWATRLESPAQCPKCYSRLWDAASSVIPDNHKHTCQRCGNEWDGRTENPKACPYCKSQLWDKEKKEKSSHTCQRCDHTWNSKKDNPVQCTKCKSPKWMTEKRYRYADGRRIGTRCICGAWYPLIEGQVTHKCTGCGGKGGGILEMEQKDEEEGIL